MATKYSEDFTRGGSDRDTQRPDTPTGGLRPWRRVLDLGQVDAELLDRSSCRRGRGAAPRERSLAQREPYPAGGEGGAKKCRDLLREPKAMRFQFIAEYRGGLSRAHLCRMMQVSDRVLRAWRHRPPSSLQRRDMILLAHIREQHRLSLGSYGRPRMTQELKELGIQVGQRRVARIMRDNGIQVLRSRKFKRTTDSDHSFNIAPNHLNQDFTATAPNQKWAGDITYIWTREGWSYLSVIIDLYSRRVIGWAISNRMKQDLALRALDMAVALRRPPPGCLHHTDRGA